MKIDKVIHEPQCLLSENLVDIFRCFVFYWQQVTTPQKRRLEKGRDISCHL